jgi:hypothetical protein
MNNALSLSLMNSSSSSGGDELPPSWTSFTTNLPSTPSAITFGTQVTAGASNTKGAVVDLLGAALTHNAELLFVGIHSFVSSGSNISVLLDIMVDPAGGTDWSVLVPNLLAGWTVNPNLNNSVGIPRTYYFPIQIPSGATIGARAQTSDGSDRDGRVVIYAVGGNTNPDSWWSGTSVEAIGIDAANSIGQMHTAGNSGAFSSWTNVGAPISANSNAVQWAAQGENDTSAISTVAYQFEFGASSSRIGLPYICGPQFQETTITLPSMPIFRSISSGTQLQVRGNCSGTAQPIDVAAYVVS